MWFSTTCSSCQFWKRNIKCSCVREEEQDFHFLQEHSRRIFRNCQSRVFTTPPQTEMIKPAPLLSRDAKPGGVSQSCLINSQNWPFKTAQVTCAKSIDLQSCQILEGRCAIRSMLKLRFPHFDGRRGASEWRHHGHRLSEIGSYW